MAFFRFATGSFQMYSSVMQPSLVELPSSHLRQQGEQWLGFSYPFLTN
jgi:hypothetical protein